MNTDPAFRKLVFLAALLAIATYAIADESIIVAIVALPLALLGWRITERRGDRAVPRAVIALAITLAIGWAILAGLREGLNVAVFCQFTIAVIVIKTFDRRTSPDLGQFVMLALFLAIGALLTSNTLWMAVALIATLLTCAAAAVAYQFHLGRAAARRAAPSPAPLPATSAPRHAPTRLPGLARTIAVGWAVAGLISIVVFLMFPRGLGADAFGQWGNPSVGMVTGFSSRVDLGEAGLISTSATPVLDLTVRAADGTLLGAPAETYYLRGAVLDRYDRGSWTAASLDDPTYNQPARIPLGILTTAGFQSRAAANRGPQVVLDIMIRNAKGENFHVFTAWRPRRITFETQARIRVNQETGVIRRTGQPGRLSYTVVAETIEGAVFIPEDAQRTSVSFDSQPIQELAASIARAAGLDPDPATRPIQDDAALAAAIERHFDTGFAYSLDIARPPAGRDPIEWFLLDQREGHCEYYASAMVALCRAVGVNSRVVTGYVATEFNDATRHYIVRESNAHAWVEVEVSPPRRTQRLDESGRLVEFETSPGQWQTRDPTPSGEFRRIHRPDPTLASRFRDLFEAINYAWITSIVAFDDQARTSIVSAMRIDTAAIDAWAEETARRIRISGSALYARALQNALIASMSTLALGLAVLIGWPLLRATILPRLLALWLRLTERRSDQRAARLALAGFYARLLRALARQGRPKPPWRPPLDHAHSLDDHALADPAARIAHALYRVRYARQDLSPADAAAIDADLAAIERRPRTS